MARLGVTLAVLPGGIRVTWRLDGVALADGDVLGEVPDSIAGAPTLRLSGEVVASDGHGALALVAGTTTDDDGDVVRCWRVGRATSGAVEVSYLAEPAAGEALPATPPLELRRDGTGLSGALKCFLVAPPGPADLAFELGWDLSAVGRGWWAVSSLGEDDGQGGPVSGEGLERLGDVYLMVGELAGRHRRDGGLSLWWLAEPGIDVDAFADRLGTTYRAMAAVFDAPTEPYRVFLRTHPHRGVNGSAHPASFVLGLNPEQPLDTESLDETLAHEVVHEWLHLDGTPEEVTWFNEGSADYYSYVVPLREGMLDDDAFLRAVNLEARECFANPRRDLTIQQAQALFFTDFHAHRLPYTRGMFYLADLDARLRRASAGRVAVDDVVRDVQRRRRGGERIGVAEWCAVVGDVTGADEQPVLDGMVVTGGALPHPTAFGPAYEQEVVDVPVLDLGFDSTTLVSRRVRGLVPGGVADRAGLVEGEPLDLPRYAEMVGLDVGDVLEVGVTRDGNRVTVRLPLTGATAAVPQWRPRSR